MSDDFLFCSIAWLMICKPTLYFHLQIGYYGQERWKKSSLNCYKSKSNLGEKVKVDFKKKLGMPLSGASMKI